MSEHFESKRTIEEVFDMETGEIINSKEFFKRPESEIYKYRRLLEFSIKGYSNPKFVCLYCNQLLKLTGKSTERGKVSFFAHLHDSDDCEIKTEGENKLSKKEIELLKYSKIRESQRHKDLKNFIFSVLNNEPSTRKGIVDINMEKRIFTRVPFYNWRQPDISFNFNSKRIVIELQLSTTFLGVVVERDVFYKMNNTFIIWVFNFSDNQQYVNLGSMMCKDIYYSNKRNAFILDQEAMNLSFEKGELVLKCVWFEPNISNGIFNFNKSIPKEEFITLDQLVYDNENFKPFYKDADKLFEKYQPLSLNQRKKDEAQIEKDIRKSLAINDILNPVKKSGSWGFENERKEIVVQPIYSEVLPFKYGVSWVKKRYWGAIDIKGRRVVNFEFKTIQKIDEIDCIIAEDKSGKYGVLSSEGFNTIPFDYSLIKYSGNEVFNVTINGRVGFIGRLGNVLTENKTQITENIFKGSQLQYWGLEDRNGKVILPFIYSKIENFVDGVALAVKSGQDGLVNIYGNEISKNKTKISDTLYMCEKFGFWGIEDNNEETIIPFENYEISVSNFEKVTAKHNNFRWGVYDLYGGISIPFEYDMISSLANGMFLVG